MHFLVTRISYIANLSVVRYNSRCLHGTFVYTYDLKQQLHVLKRQWFSFSFYYKLQLGEHFWTYVCLQWSVWRWYYYDEEKLCRFNFRGSFLKCYIFCDHLLTAWVGHTAPWKTTHISLHKIFAHAHAHAFIYKHASWSSVINLPFKIWVIFVAIIRPNLCLLKTCLGSD